VLLAQGNLKIHRVNALWCFHLLSPFPLGRVGDGLLLHFKPSLFIYFWRKKILIGNRIARYKAFFCNKEKVSFDFRIFFAGCRNTAFAAR